MPITITKEQLAAELYRLLNAETFTQIIDLHNVLIDGQVDLLYISSNLLDFIHADSNTKSDQ